MCLAVFDGKFCFKLGFNATEINVTLESKVVIYLLHFQRHKKYSCLCTFLEEVSYQQIQVFSTFHICFWQQSRSIIALFFFQSYSLMLCNYVILLNISTCENIYIVSSIRYVTNNHKSKALKMHFSTVEVRLPVFLQY